MNKQFQGQIDKILAILFLVSIAVFDMLLLLEYGDRTHIQAFILLSCPLMAFIFVYLLLRGKKESDPKNNTISYEPYLNLIFFVSLFIVISSSIFEIPTTLRSAILFLGISVSAGIICFEILHKKSGKSFPSKILIMTILLGIVLRLSLLLPIPGTFYDDSIYHQMYVQEIILNGRIISGSSYSSFPGMHLLLSYLGTITGFDFKPTSILAITVLQVIIIPIFLYLMCMRLFKNIRVALFAALLFVICDFPLMYSLLGAFPTTFAIILGFSLLYFIIFHKGKKVIIISSILLLTVVLSHSLTTLIVIFTVIVVYLTIIVLNKERSKKIVQPVLIGVLVSIGTIIYWYYSAKTIFTQLITFILIGRKGIRGSFATSAGTAYAQSIAAYEYFFDLLFPVLIFSLALVAFLYFIKHSSKEPIKIGITVISVLFFILGVLGYLFVIGIAPDRLLYYSFCFLPIPAAFGFIFLLRTGISKKLLTIFIISLTFFAITSSRVNMDLPVFSPDLTPQRYISWEENIAINEIAPYFNGSVSSDGDISSYINYLYEGNALPVDFYHINLSLLNELVIIRDIFTYRPLYSVGIYRISYNPNELLIANKYEFIFSSPSINLYYK